MARRRRPQRRQRPSDEPDWIEELNEEEEDYEKEEEYRPAPQAVPMTTILIIVAIGLALIFAVVVFKKATGGMAVVEEEDVEPYVIDALARMAEAQDIFWRDNARMVKVRGGGVALLGTYAKSPRSLYHDYKQKTGVEPGRFPKTIAEASSPEKAYRGYYFVAIGYEADGKAVDLKKNWAAAAVPAVNDIHHVLTYIISKKKIIYARDTGGQPARGWPPKEDLNVEGGWVPR